MAQISITRALAEIKSLEGRITDAIASGTFVSLTKGKGDQRQMATATSLSIVDTENKMKASLESINALMLRRNTIKAAVIASNASTRVVIGGAHMTVAEAIDRKASIKNDVVLFDKMRSQYTHAQRAVETSKLKLEEDIERAVVAAYGNTKPSDDMYRAIAEPRKAMHEVTLLDPLGIERQIDGLSEAINTFNTEVDFVLSESNARTMIDVV